MSPHPATPVPLVEVLVSLLSGEHSSGGSSQDDGWMHLQAKKRIAHSLPMRIQSVCTPVYHLYLNLLPHYLTNPYTLNLLRHYVTNPYISKSSPTLSYLSLLPSPATLIISIELLDHL